MDVEHGLVSQDTFNEAVKTRIRVPALSSLYQKFIADGIEQTSWEIIDSFPESVRRPLLYTLTIHVTKEKPVFIYAIGKHSDQTKSQFVAASTDLLWALSLIMDDVVDNDIQRADKDTAWVIFGKQPVEDAMKIILERLIQTQARRISPRVAAFLQECVDDGMRSLFAPQIHSLDSTEEDILKNIDQRARFHCEYPMMAIFEGSERSEQQLRLGAEALFASNRAGQILNDVKDLVPSNLYGRSLFSDIIGGTNTIPLRMMLETIKGADKRLLEEVFGKRELDPRTLSDLENLVLAYLPRRQIYRKVSGIYKHSADIMRLVTDDDDFHIFWQWIEYKLSQADRLLGQ